jgi:hypothetical protein
LCKYRVNIVYFELEEKNMSILVNDNLFGVTTLVPLAQGVNLSANGRLSTSSLMGTDAVAGNIAAAAELAKGGLKWQVTGISGGTGIARAEKSQVDLGGGNYGEGFTEFNRYALGLRSTSGGINIDRTLWFTSEAAAESVLSVWPEISSSDVDESKLTRYAGSTMEVYQAGATIAAGDHVSVDQVTCSGTLGGTSPRSDVVAKYGAASSDWAAGYSLSEDNFGLVLKADYATSFSKGDGIFQAASGQDTTTGEQIGKVLQVFDLHYGVRWTADF